MYQAIFIKEIYKVIDQIPENSKLKYYYDSILNSLYTSKEFNISQSEYNWHLGESLPIYLSDGVMKFGLETNVPSEEVLCKYIRSYSVVQSSYQYKSTDTSDTSGVLSHKYVSSTDYNKYITQTNNKLRILRNPIITFDGNQFIVLHDKYTNPTKIVIEYYKVPQYFTTLGNAAICELPYEVFDDLVQGAVNLYISYAAGAEAKRRQLREAEDRKRQNDRNSEEEQPNNNEQ